MTDRDLEFVNAANPFDAIERRRSEVERTNENSARLAQTYAKFNSSGQGYLEFETPVDFGLTFIEEPYMSYGCYIDLDEIGELLDLEPGETPPIPLCSGFVSNWDQDTRDFYVGCWVAARVYVPIDFVTQVPADTKIPVTHYFTFSGIALKDIPVDVRD